VLSAENNELLTRVGAGTPMGAFMRLHWLPVLLSRNLPENDGPPLRIRVLGEDLVAFRDSAGAVGVLGNHCPHRRASLCFGRNEEGGLRCPYHGWKFDVAGRCVDMPNEPSDSAAKTKVRQKAYPVVERNGVVWMHMGAATNLPPLPEVEWNLVDASHIHLSLRVQECNWLQALEGEIDSSHAPFLHSRVDGKGAEARAPMYRIADRSPSFQVEDTDAGVMIAARRTASETLHYWRVNQFLLPFYTIVPPSSAAPELNGHAWVPIDDEHTLCLNFTYQPDSPLSAARRTKLEKGGRETAHPSADDVTTIPAAPYPWCWPAFNRSNNYQIDWQAQKHTYFSGVPRLWAQDASCQESMGAVVDRRYEHLCASDIGIVRVRRRLLHAAQAYRDSQSSPPYLTSPQAHRLRSVGVMLPHAAAAFDIIHAHAHATGPFGYEVA
jgi:phenylpropionate dioxygenase-like ring-hydroxylating dioxygenase large terminal subunit